MHGLMIKTRKVKTATPIKKENNTGSGDNKEEVDRTIVYRIRTSMSTIRSGSEDDVWRYAAKQTCTCTMEYRDEVTYD